MPADEPRTRDPSGLALPGFSAELGEVLARNAHEVWARERLAEGWTPGPHRDDARKQHPGLVPYEQLPESEKDYDRKITQSTLAAIVALGYRIQPPVDSSAEIGNPPQATADLMLADMAQLQSSADLDVPALLSIWRGRIPEQWQATPSAYQLLAQRLLQAGEPLLAYDVTSEGLRYWSTDARLRQLEALALARNGATRRANELLRELYVEGATDEETVGILARTEKDFALLDADPRSRQDHLTRAADLYAESFRRHGGYWSGINAATLYALRDEPERASALAQAVHEQCLALANTREHAADYWLLATLGEAALVLGDRDQAAHWYSRAAIEGRRRLGDLASTRRNARLLLDHLGGDRQSIDQALRMPPVALAVSSGSTDPHAWRAPVDEASVRDEVHARLAEHDCLVGYASISSLADVVFLESLLQRGGRAYVVVPYDEDRYLQDLARSSDDAGWVKRAEDVLRRATQVIVASPRGDPSAATAYEFANLLLHGLALARARSLDTDVLPFALTRSSSGSESAATALAPDAPEHPTRIVAMLFADAVHFSRLGEEEVVRFSEHVMGSVGRLVGESPHAPVFTNTWGDGLFFVFRDVRDAGLFALELCEMINATDWVALGLPAEMNLRIGLHAGPVFQGTDPVTGRAGYFGTHISRAARIEPITPPGQVYASEPLAALSELAVGSEWSTAPATGQSFTCDYVGQTPQAKGYGMFPTYHVRRT
jgi:class 3 adenylate cyclase